MSHKVRGFLMLLKQNRPRKLFFSGLADLLLTYRYIEDDIHTYEVVSIAIPTDPCFSEKPDEEQSKNNIRHLIIEGFARE